MARTGLYPGTFDPVTNGHLDIISRASRVVDRLVIGVAVNSDKHPLFSLDERMDMVRAEIAALAPPIHVEIRRLDCLLIHYAEQIGASVIIRGLRAVSDFDYEFQMVGMNQKLNPAIETVFLMADGAHQAIASRLVKEIARLGGDVSPFVSPAVRLRLMERLGLVETRAIAAGNPPARTSQPGASQPGASRRRNSGTRGSKTAPAK